MYIHTYMEFSHFVLTLLLRHQLCQPLSPITFNNLWLWSSSVPIHTLVVGAARPSDMDDHLESALLYRSILCTVCMYTILLCAYVCMYVLMH